MPINVVEPIEQEHSGDQEPQEETEQSIGGGTSMATTTITLQKAVDMGEYEPQQLANFPEWHTLSTNLQFQFIRQGLKKREQLLNVQWAEMFNISNFSSKPELAGAMKNIEYQRNKVMQDKERIYTEYSEKLAAGL